MKHAFGALMAIVIAAALPAPTVAQDYGTIIAAPDRNDADRNTDKRRDPLKLLNFVGVKAGMKVLDMEAGAGYTTELLARAVGPTGVVYAQDSAEVIERQVKDKFDLRAQSPAMKGVIHVIRNYDDPISPDVRDLDLITFFFAYHDMTYMQVDRAEMNRKLFAALKPGGYLLIADHSAKSGDGTSVGKTLHRIEEAVLRKEVEATGFRLVASGEFLRHPEDTRDAIVFRAPTPIDEFVLKYQKP
jgi:predicted methyltransferase